MCKYGNDDNKEKCSYCLAGGAADTMSCPEHMAMMKRIEAETQKRIQEDSEDLEAGK